MGPDPGDFGGGSERGRENMSIFEMKLEPGMDQESYLAY